MSIVVPLRVGRPFA